MKESTAITIVASVILACATALGMHGCSQMETTRKEAIKAGLVEEIVNGGRIWTKPRYER